jgi:hypothetical protein
MSMSSNNSAAATARVIVDLPVNLVAAMRDRRRLFSAK